MPQAHPPRRPAEERPAVAVRGLTVRRGGRAVLEELSLEVRRGVVTGLLGPSGCGKTTLIRAIAGVQRVAGGEVRVLGRPAGTAELRSRVGYVTQSPAVYADLTAAENLAYFARVLGAPRAGVGEVLRTVGLERAAGQVVGSMSGGQRARVSLAAALLGDPPVLLLDEPTVGLDPLLRRDLWRTFHALAERGATLLVSSHVMDEAAECDDLVLMREGRILAATTPDALRVDTGADELGEAFLRLVEEEVPA